ncbi:uncharacterized protein LOC124167822 [Ischnura elegans]|uniref:uncharacterized protein LOC124167822 n=1 Tax=Ischnura elegans TaxID=197161 RepID=UPI001ED8B874|nr:uncharacterized protein LOC124167822 [Ischnura elegans]
MVKKINAGTYWTPLPDVVAYEASLPRLNKVKWGREFTRFTPKEHDCESRDDICSAIHTLDITMTKLQTVLTDLNLTPKYLKIGNKREKRGLDFLGAAFRWCCGVATEKQFKSVERNVDTYQQKLSEFGNALQKEHNYLLDATQNIRNYSKEMEKSFDELQKHVIRVEQGMNMRLFEGEAKHFRDLIRVVGTSMGTQATLINTIKENEALHYCRNNLFPISLVKLSDLQDDLNNLNNKLNPLGYELAQKEVTELMTMKIAQCTLREGELLIRFATPFGWKNETCVILHNVVYAAVDGGRLRTLSGPAMHDCRPFEDKLCFLPRFHGDTSHGPQCALTMFKGATAKQLNEACTLRCHPGQSTIITEVAFEKYVITHPPPQLK